MFILWGLKQLRVQRFAFCELVEIEKRRLDLKLSIWWWNLNGVGIWMYLWKYILFYLLSRPELFIHLNEWLVSVFEEIKAHSHNPYWHSKTATAQSSLCPAPWKRASSLFLQSCLKLKISWQIALDRLISTCSEGKTSQTGVCVHLHVCAYVLWCDAAVCAHNPRVKGREGWWWGGGVVECLSHASKNIRAIIKKSKQPQL